MVVARCHTSSGDRTVGAVSGQSFRQVGHDGFAEADAEDEAESGVEAQTQDDTHRQRFRRDGRRDDATESREEGFHLESYRYLVALTL
jgi:hypothetical protein